MDIRPGQIIAVNGTRIRVSTAANFGTVENPNWYIQGTHVATGLPVYIKQQLDCVKIETVC